MTGLQIFWVAFCGGMMGGAVSGVIMRRRLRPGAERFLPDPLARRGCECHCIDCRNGEHDECPVDCRKIGTRS